MASADVHARLASFDEVWVANDNGPEQTVISGREFQVDAAVEELRKLTEARVLPVRTAAHTPLMNDARVAWAQVISATTFKNPTIPILLTGAPELTRSGTYAQNDLIQQLVRSVRWRESMLVLRERVGCFVDVGPGRVLAGLVESNAPDAFAVPINVLTPIDAVLDTMEVPA